MKKLCLIPLFALSLSGCSLFGVSPEDSEQARQRAEAAVAVGEIAVGFATVGANKYAALPDCGGTAVICKDPKLATALQSGMASLTARLSDVRAALAEGLNDGERLALITDALVRAADDVNNLVTQMNGATPAGARQVTVE